MLRSKRILSHYNEADKTDLSKLEDMWSGLISEVTSPSLTKDLVFLSNLYIKTD